MCPGFFCAGPVHPIYRSLAAQIIFHLSFQRWPPVEARLPHIQGAHLTHCRDIPGHSLKEKFFRFTRGQDTLFGLQGARRWQVRAAVPVGWVTLRGQQLPASATHVLMPGSRLIEGAWEGSPLSRTLPVAMAKERILQSKTEVFKAQKQYSHFHANA